MSAPASIPCVEAVLACLVVESKSNHKFSVISNFCLIVDSVFHPSRALTRSFKSFIPSTWTFFCYGDIAATMDMTPHVKGMVGIMKSAETVSIVMGNKQVENLVSIGDIPGVVCDNQGYQILPVRMTNIVLDCTTEQPYYSPTIT